MSKRTSILLRFFVLLLILLLMVSAGIYRYYQSELSRPLNFPAESVLITVEKGESFNKVLSRLIAAGIDINPWLAKVYARDKLIASQIKVGEFRLTAPMTMPEVFAWLSANKQVTYKVQFIEGTSYKEALAVLKKQSKLRQTLDNKSHQEIVALLGMEGGELHLEGQLYPDTYLYHRGDSDLSILKRAHQRLNSILAEEWQKRDKASVLKTPYEALILASIVEKETGVPEERAEIAGVFSRRLVKGMRLQTDPTVIYGLGERYQGNITRAHLKEKTAYNTYRISGLPPTPIALVGRAAIHAALNPLAGKSLYFVARGDGTHKFSNNIEEHNKAVRKYQLQRRKDYRSSQ